MKTIIAVILAVEMLFTTGCSSSKELNERSARGLIKKQYARVHYPTPVSIVAPLMIRVPVSYTSLVDTLRTKQVKENVAVYIVKRLLDASSSALARSCHTLLAKSCQSPLPGGDAFARLSSPFLPRGKSLGVAALLIPAIG